MSAVVTPTPPATIPSPPVASQASTVRPVRWTIAEYRGLGAAGFLRDVKTMLVDGEILVMPPPGPLHDIAVELAAIFLRATFATGHFVRVQMGFDIGTRTDPSPDLVVVVGSVRDHVRTPTQALIVIEVADSSLSMDTTTKAELYATAGVPDYWVLDLENRRLVVYRDPEPLPVGLGATAYRTRVTHGPDDAVSPLAAPAATVRVADLLP